MSAADAPVLDKRIKATACRLAPLGVIATDVQLVMGKFNVT